MVHSITTKGHLYLSFSGHTCIISYVLVLCDWCRIFDKHILFSVDFVFILLSSSRVSKQCNSTAKSALLCIFCVSSICIRNTSCFLAKWQTRFISYPVYITHLTIFFWRLWIKNLKVYGCNLQYAVLQFGIWRWHVESNSGNSLFSPLLFCLLIGKLLIN